jgi:hypothetical protein
LPVATAGAGSAQAAIFVVCALVGRFFRAGPAPPLKMIARVAVAVGLNRPGRAAAIGREAAAEAASATALDPSETPLRIQASAAGDMVFVLGRSAWPDGDGRREGYSARMWQRQAEGWRIVFDEIVPGDGG